MTTPISAELKDIDQAVERLFTRDDAQRRQALRALFVEKLDFELERGTIPMPSVEDKPMPNADRIAQRDGVTIVFVAAPSDSVLAAAALSKLYKASTNTLGDVLLVCTTSDSRHWQFVYPKLIGGKEVLRRLSVQQGQPRRTFVQQLRDLVPDTATSGIRSALEQLYNVEAVTKKFFTEYKRVFDAV